MAAALRLITIPISHYCEKARWALEWAGLDYTEDAHLQVFHYLPVWRAGGRRTVPVLVHPGGSITDSADILRFADTHANANHKLFPTAPVERCRRMLPSPSAPSANTRRDASRCACTTSTAARVGNP